MKTVYLVRSIIECSTCGGEGVVYTPEEESTCPTCAGEGYLQHDEIPLEQALAELNQSEKSAVSSSMRQALKALARRQELLLTKRWAMEDIEIETATAQLHFFAAIAEAVVNSCCLTCSSSSTAFSQAWSHGWPIVLRNLERRR